MNNKCSLSVQHLSVFSRHGCCICLYVCHMFKYIIVCVLQCIVHLSNWYFPNFLLIFLLTLCWAISKFDISHTPLQTTTFSTHKGDLLSTLLRTDKGRKRPENSAIVLFRITWKIWICFCTECLFFFFLLFFLSFGSHILKSHLTEPSKQDISIEKWTPVNLVSLTTLPGVHV